MNRIGQVAAVAAMMLAPLAAHAQSGAAGGAAAGAVGGAVVGGPVGAVVGAGVGAVVGGISDAERPRFREYVVREKRPSYTYRETVRVGAELPASGVTYYDVPAEYGAKGHRYTVVNDRVVLVDPGTRRIVQIVE
ncbi:DUF1236 domain-containing protein [Enterovirga sp.]|jgi:hypothetical protein|uniref:DUF1236 domain-containing protein n=1 Tax=Enterovirga sp. TaxID=2026350 RepID=UPI0026276DAE|nr:DUF1236 domain-containing protein [Enterovirga sp.]MDB5589504.1 hypothetical protein [Enterovirga sp.]